VNSTELVTIKEHLDLAKAMKMVEQSIPPAVAGFHGLGENITDVGLKSTEIDDLKVHIKKVGEETKLAGNHVQELADAFSVLGRQAGGALGDAISGLGQYMDLLDQTQKHLSDVKLAFPDVNGQSSPTYANAKRVGGQQMAAAGIGLASDFVTQNVNTGAGASTGALVAVSALQGAAVGAMIGAPYAAATFGLSIAIGAAAGAVIGWVKSGQEWRKVVNDIGRDLGGLHVSQEFGEMIEDLEDTTGLQRVQALTAVLDKVIEQSGGLRADNIEMFTAKLHDAFSYLEDRSLSVVTVTQILDKNFANFAAVGTDATGRLSASIKEIITLNTAWGTESKAIAGYLQQQATTAVSGFGLIVASTASAATGYASLKKAVEDAQAAQDALVTAGKAGTAETTAAALAVTQALEAQFRGAEQAKQGLSDLGIQAIASFTAAVASGVPLLTAIDQIHPALEILKKSYADLGLNIDSVALKSLLMQDTMLSGNPALVNGIAGLSAEMIALDNMGLMNIETFGAMQRTGFEMYTKLQGAAFAAGGTTKDALLPMQGYLHDAQAEAELLGIPLDANTEMLIRQSKEVGIWKEKSKTANELVLDSMQKLVDKVTELVNALNGIPNITRSVTIVDPSTGEPQRGGGPAIVLPPNPFTTTPQPQALGGDYMVTRPTLFLAGEAGAERATFSGANPARTATSSGGNTISLTIPVVLDGRELTRVVVELQPEELTRRGLR